MAQMDLASLNRGRLRHPLYGNREHWYDQHVKPEFWDRAMRKGEDDVRKEVLAALDSVADMLARGGK